MSSFIFSASPFESSENENNSNYLEQRKKKKNVTFKKQPSSKVSSLKLFDNNDDDQDLADFNPPKPPKLTTLNEEDNDKRDYNENDKTILNTTDYPYNNENNNILPDSYNIPSAYNNTPPINNHNLSNHELNEKINHIIHLLEESHNEKTSNITEELILYSFLGVFIIFIVDSFTKSGKYTR